MSPHRLITIIHETPSYRRIWRKLSDRGKHRVLELANGSDFMLDTILEDVLEEQI